MIGIAVTGKLALTPRAIDDIYEGTIALLD